MSEPGMADLANLRERLQHEPELAHRPDFLDLEQRASRVRQRRAAAFVVAGTIGLTTSGLLLNDRSSAPPPAGTQGAPVDRSAPTRDDPGPAHRSGAASATWEQLTVDFADPEHGFAQQGRCADEARTSCAERMLVTEDGGRTWRVVTDPVPPAADVDGFQYQVRALGPARAVLDDGYGRPAYRTEDGGRTWSRLPGGRSGAVTRVPPGWRVAEEPHSQEQPARGLVAYDSEGAAHPLRGFPTGLAVTSVFESDDGSLWCGALDSGHRAQVVISRNRGSTWSSSTLPGGPVDLTSVRDVRGDRAVVTGSRRSDSERWQVKNPLSELWATADGGRSWQRMAPLTASSRPRSVLSLLLPADGSLLLTSENPNESGAAHTSTDGGRSFAPVPGPFRLGTVRRLPGDVLLGRSLTSDAAAAFSGDSGRTWTDVNVPSS